MAPGHAQERLERVGARLLQRGWLSANSIAFTGDDGPATVVDTGYVSHAEQTTVLIEHALESQPLDRIVNTHLHSDHCGGNAALQMRWPLATITVPLGYRQALEPWNESRLSYRETGQRCAPFGAAHYVRAGEHIQFGARLWEVHAAPGHDPEAVLFFEPEQRILISGDALWEQRLAIIFPELEGENGFGAAFSVLDDIERLKPSLVLPGHGPAFMDVAAALAQSRERLERFARLPHRHREHSARALVIYHMLEHRRRSRVELVEWISSTPIFVKALDPGPHDQSGIHARADDVVRSLISDGLLLADSANVWISELNG